LFCSTRGNSSREEFDVAPLRQLPDGRRRIGSRRQRDHELLYLAARAVGRPGEKGGAVVHVDDGHEQGQPAQVNPTVVKGLEQLRVPACSPGNRYAAVRIGFRQVQALSAVREHGREGLPGEEPPLVDLADVSDEVGLDSPRLRDEIGEPTQQLVIGNDPERESKS
jgi:hypothetical protein